MAYRIYVKEGNQLHEVATGGGGGGGASVTRVAQSYTIDSFRAPTFDVPTGDAVELFIDGVLAVGGKQYSISAGRIALADQYIAGTVFDLVSYIGAGSPLVVEHIVDTAGVPVLTLPSVRAVAVYVDGVAIIENVGYLLDRTDAGVTVNFLGSYIAGTSIIVSAFLE